MFGLSLFKLTANAPTQTKLQSFLLVLLTTNAPDLDFIPGTLIGDFNRFHQQASHSLIFAMGFALATYLCFYRRPSQRLQIGLMAGTLYFSHLLLDMITYDGAEPVGLPLLWPFSTHLFHSPYTLFGGILHGQSGDGLIQAIEDMIQWHNLETIAIEMAVTLPCLLIAVAVANRRKRKFS